MCNADESEPGTFKDRVILEHDPFALVESMTIAGYAIGASRGYLYLRGEYPLARRRLAAAIDQARRAGLLGADIAGSGWSLRHRAAHRRGRLHRGEETALFESIEGGRGRSRATSRRSRSRSGCSASRRRSTTSRRWSTCR